MLKLIFDQIWSQLKPPQALSWQTLVLLSLFSWILAFLSITPLLKELLARLGWLFLTTGLGWSTWSTRVNILGFVFRPGPWITGALACVLLFQGWGENSFQLALISWPIISAAIAITPLFFPTLNFSIPDPSTRQYAIILTLISLMLSCWFRFHFLVQDWLTDYPSLLADDFGRSAFVVRLDQEGGPTQPRGMVLLNLAEPMLRQQLEGRRWSEVEAWLYNMSTSIETLRLAVLQQVEPTTEDSLWAFRGVVPPQTRETEYTLNLQSFWQGPSSSAQGYYIQKTCVIRQLPNSTALAPNTAGAAPPEPIAQLECLPVSDIIFVDSSAQTGVEG
ncbi:DUF5357 family protein [Leptolyngbya sp. AN02str]|uniref:DUF5357 family protein n=1 Tax=Leptolyngbya sp. AN02str TaxID=3423363 RepID=UPI003D321ED4